MAIPADDPAWLELVRDSMPPFWRAMTEASGAEVWEDGDVLAAIFPSIPNRSFFNSVLYREPERLLTSLDSITDAYARAGVTAWTVWVPEAERAVAEKLERRGHKLDATPRAMAMPLSELRPPGPDPELEIVEEADMETIARINEVAYGFDPGDFGALEAGLDSSRSYLGLVAGEKLGCAIGFQHGDDCELAFVAVLPEGRGRGISARLTARVLEDAAADGRVTTTLQATKLGYPVYERLGYRDYGTLEMWELRQG
jgi:GNAT superfamily N-acetyltransferase